MLVMVAIAGDEKVTSMVQNSHVGAATFVTCNVPVAGGGGGGGGAGGSGSLTVTVVERVSTPLMVQVMG
jgi:hypothetical protein